MVIFQLSNIARSPQITSNRLIPSSSTCLSLLQKRIGQARYLFDETPHRDLLSLNSLLSHHVRRNDPHSAWALFHKKHHKNYNFDSYTFTPILKACAALADTKRAQQVHCLIIKTGSDSETITKTAMLDMYSKCGYLNESLRVFEEMKSKDVVTWNAMISSFSRQGHAKEALRFFQEMQREGVEFNGFTLCSVLKACSFLSSVMQGKQIHALAIVIGDKSIVLGTALVDFYSDSGLIGEAVKVFWNLDCRKDDAIYNSLISGCVKNRKYEEAFSILSEMEKPNVIALTSVLVACSKSSNLLKGKQIHCMAIQFGFDSYTQLSNAILDMYAKCGDILNARSVFDRIADRSVVSWSSIIDAYGKQGFGGEAVELFEKMEEDTSVCPNDITFLNVISACGHSGLVEKGREVFVLMKEKYGIDPSPDHYACYVDLLGRASLIEEVWSVYDDISKNCSKLTNAVWAALFNACRVSRDVVRGEFAAKHLIELEPENPGHYVSLSEFYVAIGREDRKEELRSLMWERGLRKEAGSSWNTV